MTRKMNNDTENFVLLRKRILFVRQYGYSFFGCESVACGYRRDFYAEGKRTKAHAYMRPSRFRCSVMQRNRGTRVLLRLRV